MRVFLDTSALAKRHIQEQGTDQVIVRLGEADEILFSVLVLPEVVSALNRRRRERMLPDSEYRSRRRQLDADLEHATVVQLTPRVLERAISCLEQLPLRSSDAIHLASALEGGADLFLSADHRQCEAARKLGLKVEEVG
jgi:hypothetical protein